MSNITIEFLDEAMPSDIADLEPDVLARLDSELSDLEARIKSRRSVLDHGLVARYGSKAAGIRGAPFGTANLGDGDYDVKVVIDKRVDWDQAKLVEACRKLEETGQDASEYVTTEIKVSESRYKAWPASVQRLFEPARTTKPGKPRITLTPRKQAAA